MREVRFLQHGKKFKQQIDTLCLDIMNMFRRS